jgi:hypothetical protein
MTSERWQRLAELFDSALEHAPAERAAFLAAACADDPLLREEVQFLLDSDERAGSFGDVPAFHFTESIEATLGAGSGLGRYEILALIGAGGMGEVYRARDPQLGREVAIKVLRRRGEISSDQLERFAREARAVGSLNHSNILAVHDIGKEAGVPYVVSELLEGETLRTRIGRGSLSWHALDSPSRFRLTAAHDKDIVHHTSPENLFIDRGCREDSTSAWRSAPAPCRCATLQRRAPTTASSSAPPDTCRRIGCADTRTLGPFAFGAVRTKC